MGLLLSLLGPLATAAVRAVPSYVLLGSTKLLRHSLTQTADHSSVVND